MKLSSDRYQFELTPGRLTLTDVTTGAQKVWPLAVTGEGTLRHAHSLTDEQCADFLKTKGKR